MLSGAGLSAAAGLSTFRGRGGLWEGRRPETLATPAAFASDPERVWRWYGSRLEAVLAARPTEAHRLLAALSRRPFVRLVTQNVDGLLQAAGAEGVVELHGAIRRARCTRCDRRETLHEPPRGVPRCATCAAALRPDVVWFGEPLDDATLRAAETAFASAALALVVGTSGVVWPAAGLVHVARSAGATVVVVDPGPTELDPVADVLVRLDADEGVRRVLAVLGPEADDGDPQRAGDPGRST